MIEIIDNRSGKSGSIKGMRLVITDDRVLLYTSDNFTMLFIDLINDKIYFEDMTLYDAAQIAVKDDEGRGAWKIVNRK